LVPNGYHETRLASRDRQGYENSHALVRHHYSAWSLAFWLPWGPERALTSSPSSHRPAFQAPVLLEAGLFGTASHVRYDRILSIRQ
jgi:hypothetical protein